jgi:hypothetical protein
MPPATGFTTAISALAIALAATTAHAEPYSCQMYREAAKKCAANTIGKCYVEGEMERLRKQCLRDGGNP